MKFKVLNELDNVILERRQFMVEVSDVKVTPKREELAKQFSAKMGLDPKTLVVDTMHGSSGTENVTVYIKSYKTQEALKKIELPNNLKKWEAQNKAE